MSSLQNQDPWYVHAGLYTIVVILVIILIKVAIIDPKEVVAVEKYNKKETRLRMTNLKEAQILWERKNGKFTNNLDELVAFIKSPYVDSIRTTFDSLLMRVADPFIPLADGQFTPESLFATPKSGQRFIVQIDTSTSVDTVVNRRGKVLRVDTSIVIGARYYIEDPDGYGTIGSLDNDALKNTASWE